MTRVNGKFFYHTMHNIPSEEFGVPNRILKNDNPSNFDFSKFIGTSVFNTTNNSQTKKQIDSRTSRIDQNFDIFSSQKTSHRTNATGLNFDYGNADFSDKGSSNRKEKHSKKENFFSDRISKPPEMEKVSKLQPQQQKDNVYKQQPVNQYDYQAKTSMSNYDGDYSSKTNTKVHDTNSSSRQTKRQSEIFSSAKPSSSSSKQLTTTTTTTTNNNNNNNKTNYNYTQQSTKMPSTTDSSKYSTTSTKNSNINHNRGDPTISSKYNDNTNPPYNLSKQQKVSSSISTSTTTQSSSKVPTTNLTNTSTTSHHSKLVGQYQPIETGGGTSSTRFTPGSDIRSQNAPKLAAPSETAANLRRNPASAYSNLGEIPPPNLSQFARPSRTTSTVGTTSSNHGIEVPPVQITKRKDMPINPPSKLMERKNATRNPEYDFFQQSATGKNGDLQSTNQNASFEQSHSANHSMSIEVDAVPKKTRVEFPEPQTAPKPFQMLETSLDASLEGEVSKEDVEKVEELNQIMNSFNAGSDNEEIPPSKKRIPIIRPEDLKRGLFSSDMLEEEEEEEGKEEKVEDEDNIEKDNENDSEEEDKADKNLENFDAFPEIEKKLEFYDKMIGQNNENDDSFETPTKSKDEIASNEEIPNDDNFNDFIMEEEEEEDFGDVNFKTAEIQDILRKFGINEEEGEEGEEEEEEDNDNTEDLLKKLEDIDIDDEISTKKHEANSPENEENTLENAFTEEENESIIDNKPTAEDLESSNLDIISNLTEENKKLPNNSDENSHAEEEDSILDDGSLEDFIKNAHDNNFLSDEEEEEEEEEAFLQENRTPTSKFKKPLKYIFKNIKIEHERSNSGIDFVHELADKLLKKQLMRILGINKK